MAATRSISRAPLSRLRLHGLERLVCLLALGLLAVLSLGALAITGADLATHKPHLGVVTTAVGRVVELDPAGPAATAGVVLGDTLTAIGGRGIAGYDLEGVARGDSDVPVSEGAPGAFNLLWVTIGPPAATTLWGDAAALVGAAALWTSGLLVVTRRYPRPGTITYPGAAFALAAGVAALVDGDSLTPWSRQAMLPALLIGLMALILTFERGAPPLMRRVWRPTVVVLVVAFGLVPLAIALSAHVLTLPEAIAEWPSRAVLALAGLTLVVPVALILGTVSGTRRRSQRLVLLAAILAIAPPLLALGIPAAVALAGAPALRYPDMRVSTLWSIIGLCPAAVLFALAFMASEQTTRRLDRLIRVTLPYAASLTVYGLVLIPLLSDMPAQGRVAIVAIVLCLLPVAQHGMARLFDHVPTALQPDYSGTLRRIPELATDAESTAAFARRIVTEFPHMLKTEDAALLLRGIACDAARFRVFTDGENETSVIDDLPRDAAASDHADLQPRLGTSAATAMPAGALWIPLWWDGAQRGALALGRPRSGDSFDADDADALSTVGAMLTLALNGLELIERLSERTEALTGLTHRLSRGLEQERAHLSRELHDVVAQELIALTRHLRRFDGDRTPPPDIWTDMLAAAQDALTATRRICNGLRPAMLDLGLVAALRDVIAERSNDNTPVHLTVTGSEQRLPTELEFAMFRIAQESLNNASHHAQASQISIEVAFDNGLRLRVRDDGRGFRVPSRFEDIPGDHLGLIGMRERLIELGGTLTVRAAPDNGTEIDAFLPSVAIDSAQTVQRQG